MDLVNVELCNLFPTTELDYLPVKKLPELYLELINSSNSISVLIKKVVYRVIMPLMWADRLASRQMRNPKNKQENPKLIKKIQMAWLFILSNSQNLLPPQRIAKTHTAS